MIVKESDICVGRTYPFALAPGVSINVQVTFERKIGKVRFVRFVSPSLKLPGYTRVSLFVKGVRAAMRGS